MDNKRVIAYRAYTNHKVALYFDGRLFKKFFGKTWEEISKPMSDWPSPQEL